MSNEEFPFEINITITGKGKRRTTTDRDTIRTEFIPIPIVQDRSAALLASESAEEEYVETLAATAVFGATFSLTTEDLNTAADITGGLVAGGFFLLQGLASPTTTNTATTFTLNTTNIPAQPQAAPSPSVPTIFSVTAVNPDSQGLATDFTIAIETQETSLRRARILVYAQLSDQPSGIGVGKLRRIR